MSSTKVPCLLVPAAQAVGGIGAMFVGPEIYGGGADWKSILASNGAGFVVGVLVNWLALTQAISFLAPGDAIRQYNEPTYTLKSLVHISTGVGIAVDQGFQWLASIIVLAIMRMNTRTFLLDLAASTVGQAIGGIGAAVVIQRKHKDQHESIRGGGGGNHPGTDRAFISKVSNQTESSRHAERGSESALLAEVGKK